MRKFCLSVNWPGFIEGEKRYWVESDSEDNARQTLLDTLDMKIVQSINDVEYNPKGGNKK